MNLIVFNSHSQSLQGEWKIDDLITYSIEQEYLLTPLDTGERYDYGNHIRLNDDNTFRTWYTAPCGMDCFTSSRGEYTMTDENHIQFRIDTVEYVRLCNEIRKDRIFPIQTSFYYIRKSGTDQGFQFVKSDGDLEQDMRNAMYSDSIDAYFVEIKKFHNLLKYIEPELELEMNPENVAALYVEMIGKSDYRILYSKQLKYRGTVVVVEIDNEWHYINCDSQLSGEKEIIYRFAIYNRQLVNQAKISVNAIDSKLKRLKTEEVIEQNGSVQETTKIYRKKGEIRKIVLEKGYSDGSTAIFDYYFQGDSLFFTKLTHDLVRGGQRVDSCREFYLTGTYEVISKEVARHSSGI
jgi:hypothetical protein